MAHANLSTLVGQALELAYQTYDEHLARTLIAPEHVVLRRKVMGEFPDHTLLSTQELMEEFEEEKKHLSELAQHSTDVPQLLHHFDRYVRDRVDEMFFANNDFRLARFKREFADQFVIAVTGILREHGDMTPQQEKKMRQLMDVYDMSITAAHNLKPIVLKYTGGHTSNLVDWAIEDLQQTKGLTKLAEQELREDGQPKDMRERAQRSDRLFEHLNQAHRQTVKVDISSEETTAHAKQLFRQLMSQSFSVRYEGEYQPHPALLQICTLASLVAQQCATNLSNDYGPVDLEKFRQDSDEKYLQLLEEVNAQFARNPTQLGFCDARQYLREQIAEAAHVPPDFDEQAQKALDHAEKAATLALPRRFNEWLHEAQLHWGEGRNYARDEELGIGSWLRTQDTFKQRLREWRDKIGGIYSPSQILYHLDEQSTNVAYNIAIACEEPAVMLAMQDYVHTLGQDVLEILRRHGTDTTETRVEFEALEAKCARIYESYRIHRGWCLDYTGGAYDNMGLNALLSTSVIHGRHYAQLTQEQKDAIPENASEMVCDVGTHIGLPLDLAMHPLVPLLYERCLERAWYDYQRERKKLPGHEGGDALYADKVAYQKHQRRSVCAKIEREGKQVAELLEIKALNLLDRIIEQFPEDAEVTRISKLKPGWRNPHITARALAECMEYLDRTENRSRLH